MDSPGDMQKVRGQSVVGEYLCIPDAYCDACMVRGCFWVPGSMGWMGGFSA